jgi:predicted anti-sigma-YlaC factor YlaD
MKCQDSVKLLSRYLDDELTSTRRASVEEHLAHCPSCRGELGQQQRVWNLIAQAEPIYAPNLMLAIEARLSEQPVWSTLLAGIRLRSIGYAAVTAVTVGLFVWTGFWAGTRRHSSDANEHDRVVAELLSDVPPGMEVVQVLDQIGERP